MGHSHHHHHGHSHGHGHVCASEQTAQRLGWAFVLNLGFALLELIGGLATNSVAILSNAFHDLGDAMAIAMAWYLERKSAVRSSQNFSYGYRRLSVVSALLTGLVLMSGSLFIFVKAIPRLLNPESPHLSGMFGLAIFGLAVNGVAAWRVSKGTSLSERMILWHLLEDVMGWAVISIGSIVMLIKPLPILDPIMAMAVATWIFWNVLRHLKETMHVFLQGVPGGVDLKKMETRLLSLPQVKGLHHLHLWTMDGESHILTAHILVSAETAIIDMESVKTKIKQLLRDEFQIAEATLEIEWPTEVCANPSH